MTIPRLAAAGRFHPASLFRPRSIAVIGSDGAAIRAHLALSAFHGPVATVGTAAALTEPPDLAIIATAPDAIIPVMETLAAKGCFAAIVPGEATGLAEAARRTGVRILGPRSFGLAVPGIGLDATAAHIAVPAGRVALVSQSAGLTRAIIDWAGPNGVGFSHVVGIGDNADVGFGMALDWLASDSQTGTILLEISHIKNRRAFLSAARAAARFRPVLAIRTCAMPDDPDGTAALAFEAALRRAGVLTLDGMEDLLAAAETLSRARPARAETLVIESLDVAAGRLAAAAAARHAVTVIDRSSDAQIPGGVLRVLTPGEPIDAPALAQAAHAMSHPLLICAMGETTGAPRRRMLAEAGLPVFASPEQAVLGFHHLVRDRRNRAAARELPGRTVVSLTPDHAAVRAAFATARRDGRTTLTPAEANAVLTAYGIVPGGDGAITIRDDAMFGPIITLRDMATATQAMDLPPLNLPLARALAERAHRANDAALAETLVRVSQLIVDWPDIAALAVGPGLTLTLRPPGAPPGHLAIAPYPTEWIEHWTTGGEALIVRPIRPEDTEAHAAFFKRLSPTDVRYRFFSAIHELSPERMARLTQVDYEREMAFIAVREATHETVAVARIMGDTEGRSGEFAVIVQADMKGKGLASHLMHRLIDWARARGMTEIVGQILADNTPMLAFIRHLGFTLHRLPEEPEVMEARLDLGAIPASRPESSPHPTAG